MMVDEPISSEIPNVNVLWIIQRVANVKQLVCNTIVQMLLSII
jgi:hypothetical protein